MKTLQEFKERIKVGAKLHTVHHMNFHSRNEDGTINWTNKDLGVREVSIKQTNAFALKTTLSDGKIADSWCYYPKSSDIVYNPNGITILELQSDGKKIPILTYTFID